MAIVIQAVISQYRKKNSRVNFEYWLLSRVGSGSGFSRGPDLDLVIMMVGSSFFSRGSVPVWFT